MEPEKSSIWYGITNPKWLALKVQFFATYASFGCYFPYLMLFYVSLGLSTHQIAIIEFLNISISVIGWPIVGSIADKSGRHSLVLAFFTAVYTISITCLALFSSPTKEQYSVVLTSTETSNFELCDVNAIERLSNVTSIFIGSESKNGAIAQLVCKDFLATNASIVLNNASQNGCSLFSLKFSPDFTYNETSFLDCVIEFIPENVDNSLTFALICVIRSFSAIALEPSASVIDAIAYDMLGSYRALWGQQRMFAEIGWGVSAGIIGVVLDIFSNNFKICFVTLAFLGSGAALNALLWLPKRVTPQQQDEKEKKLPFCKALGRAIISPVFTINCLVGIASGTLLGVYQVVWPQHMQELGAPKSLFGAAAVISSVVQVPSFFFAGAVANKIGETNCFMLMFLGYTLRCGANAFLTTETYWLALPFEMLHILCFGLFFSAATKIAAIIAPPGTSSTVQSILGCSFNGIGVGSGILLGSLIYGAYGRQISFLIYAAFALCNFFLLLFVYFVYLRKAMARIVKAAEEKARKEAEIMQLANDPLMSGYLDEL